MKFLMKLLDPRGLKPWIMVVGLVLNLVLTGLFFKAVNYVVIQQGGAFEGLDTAFDAGHFYHHHFDWLRNGYARQ